MKPILGFFALLLSLSCISFTQTDIMDSLYANFKTGNAKDIAKNFAGSVELILIDEEDVYSKAQAEQILIDFFKKNPPVSFVKVHTIGNINNKNRFGVIVLTTKTGKFRVSTTLNKNNTAFQITELRIEPEK